MNAIEVNNLSKTFRLPHEKYSTLKSQIINFKRRSYEELNVLENISFSVKKGEFLGIVGRNGSGKSTLLKLLAEIYQPTSGTVKVNGSLTPFIELGVGFNPELTGRDNVFMNGALLGMTREDVVGKYPEIVKFSELEKFMDQKLKNYSSGMQVRLAFSIAIQAHTDMLLIDEVLAVGDANFQRKCYSYFNELKLSDKTVIFVSHDMDAVKEYCDRAILLKDGEISEEGDPSQIGNMYRQYNLEDSATGIKERNIKKQKDSQRWGNGSAKINKVWTSLGDKEKDTFRPGEKIEVQMDIKANKPLTSPVVGVSIEDEKKNVIFATNTRFKKMKLDDISKNQTTQVKFDISNNLTNGRYLISCAIASTDRRTTYDRLEYIHEFEVGGWDMDHSMTHLEHEITVK